MSLQTVAHKFVELCRAGKNFDVMRTMHSPTIVSVEGDGKQTANGANAWTNLAFFNGHVSFFPSERFNKNLGQWPEDTFVQETI